MTRRLTVIVVVILGVLAAVQVRPRREGGGAALRRHWSSIGQIRAAAIASPARYARGPDDRGAAQRARGRGPQGAAFDRATDTVYVANQNDNTVSVVDARHCNSLDTSGCAQTPATAPTGGGPFCDRDRRCDPHGVRRQPERRHGVGDRCGDLQWPELSPGAPTRGPTVAAGPTPFGIAVDRRTDTVYVADLGDDAGTVSVINGATCNAITTTGCGQQPATATVGHFPFGLLIDRRDHTVYVTNAADNTVSMIDRRTCNATNTAGCARTHPTVAVGSFPIALALDRRTGSLYVGSQNFADASSSAPGNGPTIVVINARTCNARETDGCAQPHPTLTVPGGTDGMSIDQRTDTLFVSNNGPGASPAQRRSVSVIDAARCNAHTTAGCGQQAPTALTDANPGGNTHDPATDTEYVTTGDDTLDVIRRGHLPSRRPHRVRAAGPLCPGGPRSVLDRDQPRHPQRLRRRRERVRRPAVVDVRAQRCPVQHHRPAAAAQRPRSTPPGQAGQFALTADPMTNTLYSSDLFLDTNGGVGDGHLGDRWHDLQRVGLSGCGATHPSLTVPGGAAGSAENLATHTLYVADNGDQAVSVFDTATCNRANATGCGQSPARIHLGAFPLSVAVNQATDTVYVLNPGTPSTVSVIDGARCNATHRGGCQHVPPTVTVGNAANLEGLAVDEATDTVYVVNTADDTVSVIDGAVCNAATTSGCGQTPTTVPVGDQNFGSVAVDQTKHLVYVTNGHDDTVSVIDGSTCNGTTHTSCGQPQPTVPAGAGPSTIAVDPRSHDAYVLDNDGATASFIRFIAPEQPTGVSATLRHGTASLHWQRTYDGGLPIIYQVIPSPACRTCAGLTTPATSGIPATVITGLAHGTTYTFRVVARDAAGSGPPSAPSNAITP